MLPPSIGKERCEFHFSGGLLFSTVTIMILFGLVGAYVPVFKVRGASRIWFSYGPAKG